MVQATDAIVDRALSLRKPFAVVPCCVFADTFPSRRTPEGEPVHTFQDLFMYLKSKHPGIEVAFLNCKGRNSILYMRPESYRAETSVSHTESRVELRCQPERCTVETQCCVANRLLHDDHRLALHKAPKGSSFPWGSEKGTFL